MDLQRIAREMKAAQDEARQIEPITARFPGFDLAAGYEVMRANHAARLAQGWRAVGRKIGFTNPRMWSLYGIEAPSWAFVYDATVTRLAGTAATCSLARFTEPKIEPEIVLHFRAPPPPGGSPAAILAAVDWVAHAFEIVQSHCPGWRFKAPDVVADETLHGALFVGPPQPVASLAADPIAALASFTLDLERDGILVESGVGANVLASPVSAIAHLLSVMASQPRFPPLGADELVTTGTITAAQPVHPGETWRTRLAGIALPGLEIRFTA